jgi:GntR family transcriptional regulator
MLEIRRLFIMLFRPPTRSIGTKLFLILFGLVLVREQGKGTVVVKSPVQRTVTQLMGTLESAFEMGEKTNARVLDAKFEHAGNIIAKSLDINADDIVLKVNRIRYGPNGHFAYLNNWLTRSIGEKLDLDSLSETSILSQLKKQGLMPQSADQFIRATLCPPDVALLLETSVGVPLLEVYRVYYLNEKPIMVLQSLYRSDSYTYKVHLSSDLTDSEGTNTG